VVGSPGADARGFGPIELPAFSWRSIPLADLPAAPAARDVTHTVESTHVERRELNFAATNSHVREIGRIESPFHTLSYDPATGRILSIREHATRVIKTSVREGHGRVTLERVIDAPGMTHLVQRISLLADDPVIHVNMELELETNEDPRGRYVDHIFGV
jgi:hypothetical protein